MERGLGGGADGVGGDGVGGRMGGGGGAGLASPWVYTCGGSAHGWGSQPMGGLASPWECGGGGF